MNKKDRYIYPAVFEYADDGISISFPDLPGCLSCAADDEDALHMAKDALSGHLMTLKGAGEVVPEPTALVNLKTESNQRTVLVEVSMSSVRERERTGLHQK